MNEYDELVSEWVEEARRLKERVIELEAVLFPFLLAVKECQEQGETILNVKRFVSNRMVWNAAMVMEREHVGKD